MTDLDLAGAGVLDLDLAGIKVFCKPELSDGGACFPEEGLTHRLLNGVGIYVGISVAKTVLAVVGVYPSLCFSHPSYQSFFFFRRWQADLPSMERIAALACLATSSLLLLGFMTRI